MMKAVTVEGKRELVPVMSEGFLGQQMLWYEALQCTLGRREPLPNTPVLTKAQHRDQRVENLKVLYSMYGDVTPELLDVCMAEAQSATWKNKYLRTWKEMLDEGFGGV